MNIDGELTTIKPINTFGTIQSDKFLTASKLNRDLSQVSNLRKINSSRISRKKKSSSNSLASLY